MVLVEQGPWTDPPSELRRIQDRLYGCIDGALDGKLAEQFPETRGKRIVVQLDCYNVPRDQVAEFFHRFSEGVMQIPDYQAALRNNSFVGGISFKVNFDSIH